MSGVNVSYWAFNLRKPPFNDVRVRKALGMAINRAALMEQVYQCTAVKAVCLIPPTKWSHNESLVDYPSEL
jgi:ABC-type transport system substrate-binding protein